MEKVARGWKKLHKREIRDLHSTPVMYMAIAQDDMRDSVARVGEEKYDRGFGWKR
jgi:hypothetical protein